MNDTQSVQNKIPDLLCSVDAEGKFLTVNDACRNLLGYEPEELIGRCFTEFLHPDFVSATQQVCAALQTTGSVHGFANFYVRKNGELVQLEWNAVTNEGIIYGVGRKKESRDSLLNSVLFDEHPQAAFVYDPATLQIVKANQAALQLYGYTAAEMLSQTVEIVKPATEREQFRSKIKKYLAQPVSELPDFHLRSDGEIMDVIVWGKTILADSKPLRLVSIIDVTETKRNEARLKLFGSVMQNVQDGVMITDHAGHIIYVNPAFEKMSGYTFTELAMSQTAKNLFKDSEPKEGIARLQRALSVGDAFAGEFRNRTKSGEPYWVAISIAPIKNAQAVVTHNISVFRDVTHLRKADEEKNALATELLQSGRELKQFSFITTHNFRAPLSNIMAILQLVEQSDMSAEDKRWLRLLRQSTMQLNDTINDLVTILVMRESAQVEIVMTDIKAVVDQLEKNYASRIRETGAVFSKNIQVAFARFNPVYLAMITDELMKNSFKYRKPDVPLHISVSTKQTGKRVEFSFSDNGIGVDPSVIEDRIFGLYQRFHENIEGKGLGLFTVKAQAEALGASVRVETEAEKGFTVVLSMHA